VIKDVIRCNRIRKIRLRKKSACLLPLLMLALNNLANYLLSKGDCFLIFSYLALFKSTSHPRQPRIHCHLLLFSGTYERDVRRSIKFDKCMLSPLITLVSTFVQDAKNSLTKSKLKLKNLYFYILYSDRRKIQKNDFQLTALRLYN